MVCGIMEIMTQAYWEEYYKVSLAEEIFPEMESSAEEDSAVGNQPVEPERLVIAPDNDRRLVLSHKIKL
jgi:hypothetical protein